MNSANVKKIIRKKALVQKDVCVACGTCANICPLGAVKVVSGVFAEVDHSRCVGCTKCAKECPASVIDIITSEVAV